MISVTQLRAGRTFEMDGQPYKVIEYKHTKMGRGSASIRVKIRNLISGVVVEKTFISGARVEPIETEVRVSQFLYQDGENLVFMDPRTFEQFVLPLKGMEGKERFLKEGGDVRISFWNNSPLAIELSTSMVFTISETEPGVRGDSANLSFKPATLDNGLATKVPFFINAGDKIKVDTRTGEYIERVK